MAVAPRREREVEDERNAGVVMVGGDDALGAHNAMDIEIDENAGGSGDDKADDKKPRVVARVEPTKREAEDREDDRDEDARLAYDEGSSGESEERGGRRARRNRARRDAVSTRDHEIATLNGRIEYLGRVIEHVAQGQVGVTLNTIDTQLNAAQQALSLADSELRKAVSASDGERFGEVQRLRDEAAARVFQLSGTKNQLQREAQQGGARVQQRPQGQPQGAQQGPDPKAQSFTETFMSRFGYFDPKGTDEDSMIIKAIDDSVAAEGYMPNTPLYWRELEKKLAARGFFPDGEEDADGGGGGAGEERGGRTGSNDSSSRRAPVERGSGGRVAGGRPPSSSGRGSGGRAGGGDTFRLHPIMRQHLETEGILHADGLSADDLGRRNRLIRAWADGQKRAAKGEFNK